MSGGLITENTLIKPISTYTAQRRSAKTSAAPGSSADPVKGLSPDEAASLRNILNRDIESVDNMMLAEQMLMVRYMLELINKGEIGSTPDDSADVSDALLQALQAKYARPGNKVKEAAGSERLIQKAFSSAKGYYFKEIYIRLNNWSLPSKDIHERLLSDGAFTTPIDDVNFDKNYVDLLVNRYKIAATPQDKEIILNKMIGEEVVLVRYMLEIINSGSLGRGWQGQESVDLNALDNIDKNLKMPNSRVSKMISGKAGQKPLTKQAFGDAKIEYFRLLVRLEKQIENVDMGSDVIKRSQDQLVFTGLPKEGLKTPFEANSAKLSTQLKLDDVMADPIKILTAADPKVTSFEEQYARGLIVLSRWLKGIKLPEPTVGPQPPVERKYLQANLELTPEWTNKGWDLFKGKLTLSLPYPYLNFQVNAGRFSDGVKLGLRTDNIMGRLQLRADYGVMHEENIISMESVDALDMQTLSGGADIAIVPERFSLNLKGSQQWQYFNKFENIEYDWEAGLKYTQPLKSGDLSFGIGGGQAQFSSSIFNVAENNLNPSYADVNIGLEPKVKGFYGSIGGRYVVNEPSSSPYPIVEQYQSAANIEAGYKGIGPKDESRLGVRLTVGPKVWGAQVRFDGILSGYAKKVVETKKVEIEQATAAQVKIEIQKPEVVLQPVETQKTEETQKQAPAATPKQAAAPAPVAKPAQAPAPAATNTLKTLAQKEAADKKAAADKAAADKAESDLIAAQAAAEREAAAKKQAPASVPAPASAPKQAAAADTSKPAVVLHTPADTAKPAAPKKPSAPKPDSSKVHKAVTLDTGVVMTMTDARNLHVVDSLMKKFGITQADDIASVDAEMFAKDIRSYKISLALMLLGRTAEMGETKPLSDWVGSLAKYADPDKGRIKKVYNPPSLAIASGPAKLKFEINRYIDLKTYLGESDLNTLKNENLSNEAAVASYTNALGKYRNLLRMISIDEDMDQIPSESDYINNVLSYAWTEHVGTDTAAGIMSQKVVLSGTAIQGMEYNDNVCKTLRGIYAVKYDTNLHSGTFEAVTKGGAK